MKSITINSSVIYIIILLVFIAYCYFSYNVFIASRSNALIDGDTVNIDGEITNLSTLKNFFTNIGILNIINPIIIILLVVLIFLDSS
jgi:hypothetical protein